MAHELQERYSKLVLAKLRQELVLKDDIVFNNSYEGDPTAGAVKIPVRDTEVAVSDYDKANGITATTGSTSYVTLTIDKDKAVNEIIDGYDAASVPDNLVADRLDSAGYSLAETIDEDGATVLLAAATVDNEAAITKDNVYDVCVDLYVSMSENHVPKDGRYLLATPAFIALLLKSDQFTHASALGDEVIKSGAIGAVAGFTVYEWVDDTANLQAIAGHPRFATRVREWMVPVKLQSLDGSGNYIGASAVQGRMVYAHKVLRSNAIRALYAPGSLTISAAAGSAAGATVLTVTGGSGSLKYTVNPSARAVYGDASYGGTALTSGSTSIAVTAGQVIEVVDIVSGKVAKVGYITVDASMIGD